MGCGLGEQAHPSARSTAGVACTRAPTHLGKLPELLLPLLLRCLGRPLLLLRARRASGERSGTGGAGRDHGIRVKQAGDGGAEGRLQLRRQRHLQLRRLLLLRAHQVAQQRAMRLHLHRHLLHRALHHRHQLSPLRLHLADAAPHFLRTHAGVGRAGWAGVQQHSSSSRVQRAAPHCAGRAAPRAATPHEPHLRPLLQELQLQLLRVARGALRHDLLLRVLQHADRDPHCEKHGRVERVSTAQQAGEMSRRSMRAGLGTTQQPAASAPTGVLKHGLPIVAAQ